MNPLNVDIWIKAAKFITEMRKRDLLLLGFIGLFLLFIGATTGYIKFPLVEAMQQHEVIMQNEKDIKDSMTELVKISRLSLYLAREACLHGAKTESEISRCDRQTVRDAILGTKLPTDDVDIPSL